MIARRQFLQWSGLAMAALVSPVTHATLLGEPAARLRERLSDLERRSGGRLGVSLIDGATGQRIGQRQDERFPMCSTFKFLLAGAVLQRVDRGELALDQRLPVRRADLLSHAPITGRHVGGELSVAELCQATLIWSDNPAANLLLPLVGKPAGLTAFLREIGDPVSRSDRREPELNHYVPGDPRDTTTPAAMAANLQALLLGDVLRPASRQRLTDWLLDNRTGDTCLRAGLPRDWKIGDKTGSDGKHTRNDIAIVWPPGARAPLLLTAYLTGATVDSAARDAVLQAVAVAVSETFQTRGRRNVRRDTVSSV